METKKTPEWIKDGKVKSCLEAHSNVLGMLPNKTGELTIVTVDLYYNGQVVFGQQNADGEGNEILVIITTQDHVSQIEDGLAAVANGSHDVHHAHNVAVAKSDGRM